MDCAVRVTRDVVAARRPAGGSRPAAGPVDPGDFALDGVEGGGVEQVVRDRVFQRSEDGGQSFRGAVGQFVGVVGVDAETRRPRTEPDFVRREVVEVAPVVAQLGDVRVPEVGHAFQHGADERVDAAADRVGGQAGLAFLDEAQRRMRRVAAVPEPAGHHGGAVPEQGEVGQRAAFAGGEEAVAVDPWPVGVVHGEVAGAVGSGPPVGLVQEKPQAVDDPAAEREDGPVHAVAPAPGASVGDPRDGLAADADDQGAPCPGKHRVANAGGVLPVDVEVDHGGVGGRRLWGSRGYSACSSR